ncbi:MAG TPA: DcaP family trimeric outer membrane transporter [Flavobacterium sp.]|uniref:DcaP family trimeric outer membrane transporter n=1 Tax=Flavobacterium sp. TaxID=239 RepID=UPI002C4E3A5F|nr:DcaP family trimeric outer membrane transporter [Flavobacterium sp.]HSD13100.1 DcaP family trimeric outer membrane transporter [Flavobacterium sp.]
MKKFYLTLAMCLAYFSLLAQQDEQSSIIINGQIMTDAGYNFNQINPDYFDVMRPTQLPAYKNQYGTDGNVFFGVRQSMLGFNTSTPTKYGPLTVRFAFDLFGVGVDAGQTTFHLLYAYAELGKIGFGHNWSLFCDFDGFPNIVEYWGPTGMSLAKNPQLRYIPLNGRNRLAIALERPGASNDWGIYRDRIEITDVSPKFNLPDLSAEFRVTRDWGYAEIAGIVRKIEWVDQGNEPFDLSGKAVGWGFNLSTNLKLGEKDLFIGQTIFGEGIQNYMNDAPTDIGIQNDFGNANAPIKGVTLPVFGYTAYLNHQWNEKCSSVIGYSAVEIDNSNGQSPDAFRLGRYASTNFLYKPLPNLTSGIELQWIERENYKDGWTASATKIQISLRYFFSQKIK